MAGTMRRKPGRENRRRSGRFRGGRHPPIRSGGGLSHEGQMGDAARHRDRLDRMVAFERLQPIPLAQRQWSSAISKSCASPPRHLESLPAI